jgi:peptidoglycan/LPS O-acetylase OafA/YrhL
MVHEFCFILLNKLFPKFEVRALSWSTDLLFALGASVAMFYFVEEPCRKKMRKMFRPGSGD